MWVTAIVLLALVVAVVIMLHRTHRRAVAADGRYAVRPGHNHRHDADLRRVSVEAEAVSQRGDSGPPATAARRDIARTGPDDRATVVVSKTDLEPGTDEELRTDGEPSTNGEPDGADVPTIDHSRIAAGSSASVR